MYYLRYTKYFSAAGKYWTLNIYQDRTTSATATPIGPVLQGLRLVVQGDQADVDTPVVKTSLEMTFVDAYDLEDGQKNGFWEEFYTSSSTEWKVELVDEDTPIWTGYITPDSFSEELRYRGSVTIIARDNLGTLQDTTCDLTDTMNTDGKVYVYDVINKAIQESKSAMGFAYSYEDFPFSADGLGMYDISGSAIWHMVDAAKLHEMNWWEALEKTLYSIGACMRYFGNNEFKVVPLRDLPKCGASKWSDVPKVNVKFVSCGHRELAPGAKSITETQEWEVENEPSAFRIATYDGKATLSCQNIYFDYKGSADSIGPDFNVPAWGYKNQTLGSTINAANSCLLDINNYTINKSYGDDRYGAWDDDSIIYMAVNNRVDKPVIFAKRIFSADAKVKVGFNIGYGVTLSANYTTVMNLPGYVSVVPSGAYFYFRIIHSNSQTGAVSYYDTSSKVWKTSSVVNNVSGVAAFNGAKRYDAYEFEITLPAAGTVKLELVRWQTSSMTIYVEKNVVGLFGRISNIHIDAVLPEDIGLTKKLTLTTNYSSRYAVRLTRDPLFNINVTDAPEVAYLPTALLNEGAYQYRGVGDWVWLNGRTIASLPSNTGISLARLIHQQLLAYYATPNNVLTGELVDVDLENPFSTLYMWGGVEHMLMSGTLNVLTGRMESAVLRSFTRYEDMWETNE